MATSKRRGPIEDYLADRYGLALAALAVAFVAGVVVFTAGEPRTRTAHLPLSSEVGAGVPLQR